jgi:hypothetical protein
MPIEPHAVRFQVGTIVPPSMPRTPEQYRDDLRRKFGRVPSYAELAAMEGKVAVIAPRHEPVIRTPAEQARANANASRAKAKTLASLALIMSRLDKPMTAQQLSPLVRMTSQAIGSHLRAALNKGLVTRSDYSWKKATVWEKVT